MASQPSPPGDRTPRTPPPPAPSPSTPSSLASLSKKCIVLVDWWLEMIDDEACIAGRTETPQIRNGSVSARAKKGTVGRLFKGVIARRWDTFSVETASGCTVLINGILNESKMHENGFSDRVYRYFRDGIPKEWNVLDDESMDRIYGHPESPSEPVDDASYEQFLDMLLSNSLKRKGFSSAQEIPSSLAPSGLVQPGTPKCCNTSAKTEDVSEESKGSTSQSGRVLGGPPSAPKTGANKRKVSNNNGLAKEALSPTADLTSRGNSSSVAGIVAEDKLQSHDSHDKARRKTRRGTFR